MEPLIKFINHKILTEANHLTYEVKDYAPSRYSELINENGLKIWSGESDNTVFQDETVNWSFRALHDNLHLKTGLQFSPEHEIELGRIQAAYYGSKCQGLLSDLVYVEVAEQARYYSQFGTFVPDQVKFSLDALKALGYSI